MALETAKIEAIIRGGGLIKKASTVAPGIDPMTHDDMEGHVDYCYMNRVLTVGDGEITLTRVANEKIADTKFNCVDVVTNSNKSCLGPVRIPGYVFTDNFSGCVFYLYKSDATHVIGVHAHQGLEDIKTKVKYGPFKLRSKVINSQVRKEYGPGAYMEVRAKKMLSRHETRGQLTTKEKENAGFLAFLSCVELNKATTFLYVYKGGVGGWQIVRLVDKFVDEF